MPEHLRALIVILLLATTVFIFAKAPACAMAMKSDDFVRRRNLWIAITLIAFLAHNFWVYIIVAAVLLGFAAPGEQNKLAMFFFLLFALPAISVQITGLGVIEHFFAIHYVRLLTLVVLLPAFLYLPRKPDNERFGRTLPDKLIAGFLILNFSLQLSVDTLTNSVRNGVFYAFIDVFLPYYVASRSLRTLQDFRDALMAFVIAAMVLGAIGVFEFTRGWLLYSALPGALGASLDMGYLVRGMNLRAMATTGQPIPLGYVMAVAIGFSLYLRKSVPNQTHWHLGLILLLGGLIASLSRGPWIGAIVILLMFVATGRSSGRSLVKFMVIGALFMPALFITPFGQSIIDHLPFIGSVEAENITYRQRLLEISIQLIMQNPLFGSSDFYQAPAMQELRQGSGLIDIVNTYVGIALAHGLVGLTLFSGFFIAVGLANFRSMRHLPDKSDDRHVLGQALLSTLLGILVIIFTVSSIGIIPVVYWAVAGLCAAYVKMITPATTRTADRFGSIRPATIMKQ